MSYVFGFIGAGNMGSALIQAASQVTKDILICDKDEEKAKEVARRCGCACGDIKQIAKNCRFIFLGVKPQMMQDMLSEIKDILAIRKDEYVLVTMAAGLSIKTVREMSGAESKIIRIMPNMPVSVFEGEILYSRGGNVTDEELNTFLECMNRAGALTPIDESLMDAGCSLSGCGPAFVYMFINSLAKSGASLGLDEKTALSLAAQTVLGSAKLFISSNEAPKTLIDRVCSKGGSTIEGVRSLESDGFYDVVSKALTASYNRNVELGKM